MTKTKLNIDAAKNYLEWKVNGVVKQSPIRRTRSSYVLAKLNQGPDNAAGAKDDSTLRIETLQDDLQSDIATPKLLPPLQIRKTSPMAPRYAKPEQEELSPEVIPLKGRPQAVVPFVAEDPQKFKPIRRSDSKDVSDMVAIGKPLQFEPVTLQTYEMPVKQKKKLLKL